MPSLMKASELRASLLQEAVSGRLVPQMDSDGSAVDLLQEIAAERAALVAAGKLKKEKPLPAITEEEIPFEIPESWEWVRLGDIGSWSAGGTPNRAHQEYYTNGTISWLKSGDLNDGYITSSEEKITQTATIKSSAKINPIGTVILAMYGATIGKTGILSIEAATNQACCACQTYTGIFNRYLQNYLLSQRKELTELGWGSAQPNISREKIVNYLFPLPPLSEQHRIVAKLEELMPLVDAYEKEEEALSKLNAGFPERMRRSILQEAVSGKLVPQLAEEGSAADLLKEMGAHLFTNENGEMVPQNWGLTYLGDIVTFINGRAYKQSELLDNGLTPVLRVGNLFTNEKWYYSDLVLDSAKYCNRGDLLYAWSASFGPHIWDGERAIYHYHIWKLELASAVDRDFLYYWLIAESGKIKAEGHGIAMIHMTKAGMEKRMIALPPIAEQRRIVAKVNELMKIVDKIALCK